MSKKDVIDYVMHTPGNSNPAVLKSLLEGVENKPAEEKIMRVDISNPGPVDKEVTWTADKLGDGSGLSVWSCSTNHSVQVAMTRNSNIEGYKDDEVNWVFLNGITDIEGNTYSLQITSESAITVHQVVGNNTVLVTMPFLVNGISLSATYVETQSET